jgi:hypothetical protein
LNPRGSNLFRRQENGMFDQAAEFFLPHVVMGPGAGGKVLEGFIFHLQAFKVDDLQVFVALIPDLTLH